MKKKFAGRGWLWTLISASAIASADSLPLTPAPTSPTTETGTVQKSARVESADPDEVPPLLAFRLRVDGEFSGGGPVVQGFSIPSLRFAAYGEVTPFLDYRFSVGETREFSTVLLPQIVPAEAYIDLKTPRLSSGVSRLTWRFGMFRPTFNPWWTPDLDVLPIPDYYSLHSTLFLNNDIGTELAYRDDSDRFLATVGAFNGNGNFNFNTDDARAVTASVREKFPLTENTDFTLGAASYLFAESSQGSINYRYDWVGDLYAYLEWRNLGVNLGAELISAYFEDSVSEMSPFAGSAFATYQFTSWAGVLARYEQGRALPGNSGTLTHYQVGPTFDIVRQLKFFLMYDHYVDSGGPENSFFFRVRLVI